MERLHYIDYIRNTANAIRLFIHAGVPYMVTVTGMWPVNEEGNWFFDIVNFEGHLFVMELFFLVAGFMFAMQYQKIGLMPLIYNRIQRIVMPFILGMVIIVPFMLMLFGLGKFTNYQWLNYQTIFQAFRYGMDLGMQNFFPTGHLWFLYYLILFYTLSLIIIGTKVLKLFPHVGFLTFIPIACVLSFTSMNLIDKWIIENPITLVPEVTSFIHFYLFFIGGQLLYNHKNQITSLDNKGGRMIIWGLIVGLLSACCQLYYGKTNHELYRLFEFIARSTYIIASYLLAYGIWFYIKKNFTRSSPLAQYLANASYWIYLVNLPIVMFLHLLFLPIPISIFIKFFAVLILGVLISFCSFELKQYVKMKLGELKN